MKTYKIKSLFFFGGFVLSAIFYYHVEQEEHASITTIPSEPTTEIASKDLSLNTSTKENVGDLLD